MTCTKGDMVLSLIEGCTKERVVYVQYSTKASFEANSLHLVHVSIHIIKELTVASMTAENPDEARCTISK